MARLKSDYISRIEVGALLDEIANVTKDERAKLGRKDPGYEGLGRLVNLIKGQKAVVAGMNGIKGIAVP